MTGVHKVSPPSCTLSGPGFHAQMAFMAFKFGRKLVEPCSAAKTRQ